MDAELKSKIDKAIAESLPSQIGTALEERLRQADADATNIKARESEIVRLNDLLKEARNKIDASGQLNIREKAVAEREIKVVQHEHDLAIRDAILHTQLKATEQRIADAKEIVLSVFANNRFKYSEQTYGSRTEPDPKSSYSGATQQITSSGGRTVQGEG